MLHVDQSWAGSWWSVQRGLAITRRQPDLYLKLVLPYSLPPLAAAGLVVYGPRDTLWCQPLVFLLPLAIKRRVGRGAVALAMGIGKRGRIKEARGC